MHHVLQPTQQSWMGPNGVLRKNVHGVGFIGPNGIAQSPEGRRVFPDMSVEENLLIDRKSTRLNSSHYQQSRMPSSA